MRRTMRASLDTGGVPLRGSNAFYAIVFLPTDLPGGHFRFRGVYPHARCFVRELRRGLRQRGRRGRRRDRSRPRVGRSLPAPPALPRGTRPFTRSTRIEQGIPTTGREQTRYWSWCAGQFVSPVNVTQAYLMDNRGRTAKYPPFT